MDQTFYQRSYRYDQLEGWDRPIRLLTLFPSSNEETAIKCSVTQHSLDSNPSYEALSYTWGDPCDVCPIPIDFNGHPTLISTNLEAALRLLRYIEHPRVLWIDALCINQNDVSEKEKQVAMMGTIFERAQNVVVWLGPESEDSDLAVTTISKIHSVADLEAIEEPAWTALENLFSRSWFYRVWVLQEFKRGQNLFFKCGHVGFNWDNMREVLQEMFDGEQPFDTRHIKLLGEIGKAVSMASIRLHLPLDAVLLDNKFAAIHLTTILRTYAIREATKAHDKIYGLLGLSNSFTFADLNPPGIHYGRPVEEVYTDWARFLIKTGGALDLLYITQRMEHGSALPSWAPDWRKPRQDFLLTLDTFECVFGYQDPTTDAFDATPHFTADGKVLLVKGYILKTLDAGIEFVGAASPTFIASKLKDTSQKDLLLACLLRGCKIKNATVEDVATMGIVYGRQQFRSSTVCNGLLPLVAKEGDIICMLGDSRVPFVLRPVVDRYQLIGDAYIDVPNSLPDGYVVQDFAIQ